MNDHKRDISVVRSSGFTGEISGNVAGHAVQAATILGDVHLYPAPPLPPPPHQLPAAPRLFVGRRDELALMTDALGAAAEQGGTVVISAIAGTGGIGKTWLALHWAHRHLDRFPDGQIFVDLRGFTPGGEPLAPEAALRGFLDALGVEPSRIPLSLEAKMGLYRSLVADKRMLLVLDNARDTAQVAPLLPGSTTCTVLITSRGRLNGMITAHGARPVPLDVLSDREARELFSARLGASRMAAEPEAVDELLAYCAGFPLALSIVAARAESRPDFPLAAFVTELRDTATRMRALGDSDATASLPTVLSWSYAALPLPQARMLGLLGIANGPDIGLPAAAALAGLSTPDTRVMLSELERVSLVQEHLPGRYQLHDLLRLFAVEQAHQDQPPTAREGALRRLVDFYLHTTYACHRQIGAHSQQIPLQEPVSGSNPLRVPDLDDALSWSESEHQCLLTAQQLATQQEWYAVVWQLAWAMSSFYRRRGHLQDLAVVWRAGLAAAELLADSAKQAWAHQLLGHALSRSGSHTEAAHHLQQAHDLAEQTGDIFCQAIAHRLLAKDWARQNDDQRALSHAGQSLRLYQELNLPIWEADALNMLGLTHARLGGFEEALAHCEDSLGLHRRQGHREGEADTLTTLGYVAHRTGEHAMALEHYEQALSLYQSLGATYNEAEVLERLGQVHTDFGHHRARGTWQLALSLYRAQHRTADADRVRGQLASLDGIHYADPL